MGVKLFEQAQVKFIEQHKATALRCFVSLVAKWWFTNLEMCGFVVGSELARQSIKGGVVCVGRGREETLLHRFWFCPHTIMVWNLVRETTGAPLISPHRSTSLSQLRNWILDWMVSVND